MPTPNDPNDRNCYNCTHTKVCHMRIELAKQVNRFKYLAATSAEVKNTNAELTVTALDTVVAQTCTEFNIVGYDPQPAIKMKMAV